MISTRFRKVSRGFRGDDEIDITLAVTGFNIGQAMPLIRQRAQRLGNHE